MRVKPVKRELMLNIDSDQQCTGNAQAQTGNVNDAGARISQKVSPRCFEKIGTHAGLDRGLMNQCQKLAAPLMPPNN
jgi:hypothetical protein